MAARRIVLATRNAGKVPELQRILSEVLPGGVEVVTLADVAPDAPDVVEDGTSFEANSLLKARAACELTGLPAIADDSGLCVDVLGGAPGIFSARWSGGLVDSTGQGPGAAKDADNNALLLAQLSDVPDEARGAHFACVMSYVDPQGSELTARGEMHGSILRAPQGENGFGYDPVFAVASQELAEARFIPVQGPVSSAELPAEVKSAISHRGRATRELARLLAERAWGVRRCGPVT